MRIDANLIKMFGASVISEAGEERDFLKINEEAMKKGYLIDPKCCNYSTYNFVLSINTDYNSTFYRSWADLTTKNRLEIYIDQMHHYFTAYYTDETWVPNSDKQITDVNIPSLSEFKIIKAITAEEMYNKCFDTIASGIALAHETMVLICNYIIDYSRAHNTPVSVDEIVNKEAQVYICGVLGVYPNDKFALLRYLVYRTSYDTLVIKSPEVINTIKLYSNNIDLSKLSEKQLMDLSSIFYRFKPIFLAFGHKSPTNKKIVNRLRRMAVKNHKPFHPGGVETLLSSYHTTESIQEIVGNLNNFKIISLMQTINDRILIDATQGNNFYVIRNGKSFLKVNDGTTAQKPKQNNDYLNQVYEILENQLVKNLSDKALSPASDGKFKHTVIKFPKGLNIACPTSEKNFIGNIPLGSSYDLTKHNIIGIYWRNDWGAQDLDLSYVDFKGNRIGWNTNWVNASYDIMYSGDIVTAPNGANELMYCSGRCPNGIIYINRFNGEPNNKFDFFIAKSKTDYIDRDYMVNPNDVLMRESITQKEHRQFSPGFVLDNKFYFLPVSNGSNRVSFVDPNRFDIVIRKSQTSIDLRSILKKAGFIDYDDLYKDVSKETGETIYIYKHDNGITTTYTGEDILDMTELNKDTLIGLFK